MNGLPALAQDLASRGRNGDSMLVHMTPGEVQGLQALALSQGGSLSINPDTGLVEANFLKRMLPMIAGAALTIGSGGAINPLTAGMIVGGVEGIRTGDVNRGLMAGLGAYGGAGFGAGLANAGASAAAPAVSTAAPAASGVDMALTTTQPAASYAGANLGATSAAPISTTAATPSAIGERFATAGRGLEALGTESGRSAFMGQAATGSTPATGIGGFGGLAKSTLASTVPFMAQDPMAMPGAPGETSEYKGPYKPSERQVRYPTEEERRRMGTGEFTYFTPSNPIPYAGGGSVPMLEEGGFVLTKKAVDGLGGGDNKRGQQVAQKNLGAKPIRGPGTGTSDSIRTSIAGKQPALVSNGEAYVPEKKVKQNGGAKAFYELMARAEKAAKA